MLRIYLDQAKWIDLSKCRLGRRDGEKFEDSYDAAMQAVANRDASFVLSCAHYFETQRRAEPTSRRHLGEVMAKLSLFNTIAPVHTIVPAEIRQYLTGETLPTQIEIFGTGFNHAFSTNLLKHTTDASIAEFPLALQSILREKLRQEVELFVLAAPPDAAIASREILETASKISEISMKFAELQGAISHRATKYRLRHRLEDVSAMTEVADILKPLKAEFDACGFDLLETLGDREKILDLLHGLPSRWVASELRRMRLRNPQQPWTRSDSNDILALSIAVPYCDVVVTERQWATHINQLGLAEQYGTTVRHDLTELADIIRDSKASS